MLISIEKEKLQDLLDISTKSMDFGSGFLCDDDVETLRYVAITLGINPENVTPSNHICRYRGFHWVRYLNSKYQSKDTWYCSDCDYSTFTTTSNPTGNESEPLYNGSVELKYKVPTEMPKEE